MDNILHINEGEYFNERYLPAGIVFKDSTGIGATEHELKSPRNSIVIAPLNSILDSKRNDKILTIHASSFPDEDQLVAFLKRPGYKKIHTNIESFPKILKISKRAGIEIFKDYHFMLDEVHLFQTEVHYRQKLSKAFDFYKMFPEDSRTCISAFLYEFSDPELGSEPKTQIKRNRKRPRDYNLLVTNDAVRELVKVICLLEKAGNKDQVFIFTNSIDFMIKVIQMSKITDVSIFCGNNISSQSKAGKYFEKFTSNPTKKYSFYTSACFTGCDIYSEGIQITVSAENYTKDFTLPKSDLVQIDGRLRAGPTQRFVIATYNGANLIQPIDSAQLIKKANANLKRIQSEISTPRGNRLIKKIMASGTLDEKYLRESVNGDIVINYELIDHVCLWSKDKSELYANDKSMESFLKTRGNVKTTISKHKNLIRLPHRGQKSKLETFTNALSKIIDFEFSADRLNSSSTVIFEREKFVDEVMSHSTGLELKFLEAYYLFPNLTLFTECNGDLSKFKSSEIRRLVEWNDKLMSQIMIDLPVGARITLANLIPIVKNLQGLIGLNEQVTLKTVKRHLRNFVSFKEVQISRKKIRGIEITKQNS